MAHRLSRPLAALLIACSAPSWIHAAEMGEPRVRSHIGEQLVADIELTSLEDAATPVQVHLASADVYRGASIAMPPVLASLNMTVARRDGRQFLHLTSLKPVESDHLHLYVELVDGGQRSVRLATLWLTPDPAPAPPPVRIAAPVAVVAPAAAPAAAVPTAAAAPAAALAPAAPVATAKAVPAAAPAPAVVPRPSPVSAPARAQVKPARVAPAPAPTPAPAPARLVPVPARAASAPTPAPAAAATRPVPLPASAAPAPVPLHAAAPAACPQPLASAQVSACVALDGKNAALRAQIGELEGKVRALQAGIGRAAPAAPARARAGAPAHASAAAPAHARAAAPASQPPPAKLASPRKQAPARTTTQQRQAGEMPLPWLWIGAGVAGLLAAGGAVFATRRIRAGKAKKAKQAKAAIVVTPNVMGGVKSRLMTDTPA